MFIVPKVQGGGGNIASGCACSLYPWMGSEPGGKGGIVDQCLGIGVPEYPE